MRFPWQAAPVDEATRDFVARQYAHELAVGKSIAQAAESLRRELEATWHADIDALEKMFAGESAAGTATALTRMLRAVRDHGGHPEHAYIAFQHAAALVRPAVSATLAGVRSFTGYLAMLVAVLFVIVTIFSVFVLPQFANMFETMGAPLPRFTTAIVGNSWIAGAAVLIGVLLVVAFHTGAQRLRKQLLTLRPLSPWLGSLPGLGRWTAEHQSEMWLVYYGIALDATIARAPARQLADDLAGRLPAEDRRGDMLQAAERLGRLQDEIAVQLQRGREAAAERFERLRDIVANAVRLFVYMIISAYVIAMYLPIFKLGAIV